MLNIPWIREYWFLNIVDMKNPIFVMVERKGKLNIDCKPSNSYYSWDSTKRIRYIRHTHKEPRISQLNNRIPNYSYVLLLGQQLQLTGVRQLKLHVHVLVLQPHHVN